MAAAAETLAAPGAASELALEPSLQQAEAYLRGSLTGASAGEACNLIALRHSFIDDCETPVSAFLKLRQLAPNEPAFLLESADQGQRVGRWSFIGFRPREVVRWSLGDGGDPYELAATHVARFHQPPIPDAPPFTGGAVGYFGYDLVRTVEPLGTPRRIPWDCPTWR